MNDLEEILRSDAERWQGRLRPVADLDEQLHAALLRPHGSRRLVLPILAAAVVVAIAVAVVAVGLGGKHHGQPGPSANNLAPIIGVVWKDPRSPATVVYTATTMRLFDGCDNELAHLLVERGALVQGEPIGPEGRCSGNPGASRAQQQRLDHFYAVVAGPASWSRSGDVLTLTTPGKGTLRLTTNRTRAPMLSGTSWKLAYYSGTDQDEHPAPTPVPLVVHSGGTFTAGLNCGLIFGIARVSAQTIRFTNLGPSSCASGPDAASKIVLEIIGAREATYAIRGNQLIIDGKNGRQLLYQS